MISVVEPSYNICNDLESSLEEEKENDDNTFWKHVRANHKEMVRKFRGLSKKYLDGIHQTFLLQIRSAESYKDDTTNELNKSHHRAIINLQKFLNIFYPQMSELMTYLWDSRQPTHESVTRRQLFLNEYKETCLGIWSTFHPAIRQMIKGVEAQMQTILNLVQKSKKPIPVEVPQLYVPVFSPSVINYLKEMSASADTSKLPAQLGAYFQEQHASMVAVVEENLTNFENGLKSYYNHLLQEPHRSDVRPYSPLQGRYEPPEIDEVFEAPKKKREKLDRVKFGHVKSDSVASVKRAITDKYLEIITPLQVSVFELSATNILHIQLKFYELVKAVNEICESFIKSGYLIYVRLN